jgi:hypothetical protein
MVLCVKVLERDSEKLEKDTFIEKYGTLTEEIDVTTAIYGKAYYGVFMLRRLLYACILVIFHASPYVQLYVCLFLLTSPVLFFGLTRRCSCTCSVCGPSKPRSITS